MRRLSAFPGCSWRLPLAQTRFVHSTRPLPSTRWTSLRATMDTPPSSDAPAMAPPTEAPAENTHLPSASDLQVNVHCNGCETHLGIFENEWYYPCAQSCADRLTEQTQDPTNLHICAPQTSRHPSCHRHRREDSSRAVRNRPTIRGRMHPVRCSLPEVFYDRRAILSRNTNARERKPERRSFLQTLQGYAQGPGS